MFDAVPDGYSRKKYNTSDNTTNKPPAWPGNLREVGGYLLITVHYYSSGIAGTRQVITPVGKTITGGSYRLKAHELTAGEDKGKRIRV